MKATHTGHCQVCGHHQKLPGGVLSKHGYTKRWGFFSGTCTGSRRLPFEQDISLIDGAIALAERQRDSLVAEAQRRRTTADPNDVVCNCYETDWRRFGMYARGYQRLPGRIEQRGATMFDLWFVSASGKYEYNFRFAGMGSTPESAAKHLNEQQAWAIDQTVKQIESYIEWQRARIKDWQPSELLAIA